MVIFYISIYTRKLPERQVMEHDVAKQEIAIAKQDSTKS